ncbi:MAG: hypothetical protein Q8S32_15060 [Burkholderiaceae bacterium]|nr:hypothetical protein [Burkholderiaceae bacterium]
MKRKAQKTNHPQLSASQRKVLNKLYDFGPDGFANGLSTEKYTSIAQVSRATAYRELTDLVAQGVLVKSGVGRGTWYALVGAMGFGTEGFQVQVEL